MLLYCLNYPWAIIFCGLYNIIPVFCYQTFFNQSYKFFFVYPRPNIAVFSLAEKSHKCFFIYRFRFDVGPPKIQCFFYSITLDYGWLLWFLFVINDPDGLFGTVILLQPLPPLRPVLRGKGFCLFYCLRYCFFTFYKDTEQLNSCWWCNKSESSKIKKTN